ncbi:MAG: phosphate signaling complex protein PhoU [Verrucomicrobiae bacterium]|nr:phosphate signaling complex protein PhoU [Verrucomicrobiae bacterium]MCX7723245.1 phosphate signaling complex protein PhoU [Verrucomicrobiae bacterium]MDW7979426.1 phosphate signaling complex protein PhoU [Verrucomicrobiales bacterium]
METHFEHELNELKQRLLEMASYAETAVRQAIEALTTRNEQLAVAVRDNDAILDKFEVEIDEMAIALLARAPLASQLRLVTVAMKISQNLERVGDEAAKIAKRARDLCRQPPLKAPPDLSAMATVALSMLKAALDAFVNHDPAAARAVIQRDIEEDTLHKQVRRELAKLMMENPENVNRALDLLTAAKCLERIADHATNIAEEVVYLYEGQDIRHMPKA